MKGGYLLLSGLLSLAQVVTSAPTVNLAQSLAVRDEPTKVVSSVPSTTFADKTIFSPPTDAGWTDPRVLYARMIQLESGALLATWENYSPEPPLVYYPIYQSLDGGLNWAEIGRVTDDVNGWGNRYQPFLYQLPQAIGDFPAGTILCAGNSLPSDLKHTKIDVYASRDQGFTWEFVSSVASGGEGRPVNGLTPVWEPFILTYKNQLILYYADQRDPAYGQKLSHQVTTNLLEWSDPVNDVVTVGNYEGRPGMPVITKLPNCNYIFTYEQCGNDGCRIHYRLGPDPLDFLNAPDYSVRSDKGTRPSSSPYVVWSSLGGGNGTIILSAATTDKIYVNKNLGAADSWIEFNTPQPRAYTRALMVYRDDPNLLGIIGAGWLPPSAVNYVSNAAIDLTALGV
ncbi:unnamed protein product [Clonostachys rhizophaga]|uniref:Glycoside hydrolase family 93 protein n=1 Tax=Clonostachys rhizophaga TaxID=160324 RepID=A0A9N9VD90_9HYPO|nr:unnamed protein product [Clonostachys rhizophaga]